MKVIILDKKDNKEVKKQFNNVWECRDEGDGMFIIKFHNHLCHRYPFDQIKILEISKDVNNETYL